MIKYNDFDDDLEYIISQVSQGRLLYDMKKLKSLNKIMPILFGNDLIFISNETVQILVDEYQEFTSLVSAEHSDLYEEETKFIRNHIFGEHKNDHPLNYIKYLFPIYSESMGHQLIFEIIQIYREIREINSTLEDSRVSFFPTIKFLVKFFVKYIGKDLIGCAYDLKFYLKNQKNIPRAIKIQINEKISHLITLMEIRNHYLKNTASNLTEFARHILTAINYTQSHIDYFFRYIHRLVHINLNGNTKYKGTYYRRFSKRFDTNEFKKMCTKHLNDYENLKIFLIDFCDTFSEFRHISAHQIPKKFVISSDKTSILFSIVNKKEKVKINHEEMYKKILTYGVFINKIQLHPSSPYDDEEDLFITFR